MDEKARDKIITGRVRLQRRNPFFSYLVMHLNLVEFDKKHKSFMKKFKQEPTMAVDMKGNLYYCPDFVNTLTQEELQTVLCHEVMHVALLHLSRLGKRNMDAWNISTDLVINNTLLKNNFDFGKLEKSVILPNNDIFVFGQPPKQIVIKDVSKKYAEEIYEELWSEANKKGMVQQVESYEGFDSHMFGDGDGEEEEGKGKGMGKEAKEKLEREWKKRLTEAVNYAKNQGNLPAGMDRYIEEILDSKMNWREMLYRYVTKEIPFDFDYNRPHRRSQSVGYYLPTIKKEMVDISVAIDTSGSIGQEELTEFLSELVGISNSFDSVRINLLFWDTKLNNHYVIDNNNKDEIVELNAGGGGGTDFTNIYDKVEELIPQTKLLVFFTDGYASFPSHEQYRTLWVLNNQSCSEKDIPFGDVVKL